MTHSGGDGYFMFIVHSRWIQVASQPRVVVGVRANTGGEPCGDTERYSVCLVFLNGADVCVNCCKVLLCDSSSECLNSDIS